MKRTLSLIGLLIIGILLLFNPDTGLITAVAGDTAVALPAPEEPSSATVGEPPTMAAPPPETPKSTTSTTSTTMIAPADGSVLGASIPTQFGPFQVEIVIENGEMVDVITIEEPPDRKSQQINDYVIPIYEEDVISTQSATIDAISGATITWSAYTASVQSAMIQAGI